MSAHAPSKAIAAPRGGILVLGALVLAFVVACGTGGGLAKGTSDSDAGAPSTPAAQAISPTPSPALAPTQSGLDPDVNSPGPQSSRTVTRAIRYSRPVNGEQKEVVLDLVDVVGRDDIQAIDSPEFITALEGSGMGGHDLVIGLSINGETKAYSAAILSRHEIVNDVVGGTPVAVTWCPLCYTGMVFVREIDGKELTFGVSGKLIMNNLVMYDRQTDSLWSQFLGEAVEGPMAGTKLQLVASQLTIWSVWKEEHPDTLVLDIGGLVFDEYAQYYADPSSGVLGQSNHDDRLIEKDLVVGIVGERGQRAYAHKHLTRIRVLNDTFEGRDIVVTLDLDSGSTAVFDRVVDGQVLTFSHGPEPLEMTDVETGTVWNKLTGVGKDGPLKGKRLTPHQYKDVFWFAWTDFYPNTELFEP